MKERYVVRSLQRKLKIRERQREILNDLTGNIIKTNNKKREDRWRPWPDDDEISKTKLLKHFSYIFTLLIVLKIILRPYLFSGKNTSCTFCKNLFKFPTQSRKVILLNYDRACICILKYSNQLTIRQFLI